MSKKVRLALFGASNIATKVLPSIRKVSEIEVVAVAAARPGKAKAFAEKHGIKQHFDSYEACLADPSVDAVYISTLNSDHAKHIQMSLTAGKHVLCEKPMVPTAEEAKAAFDLASSKNLVLLEGFMYRFHPQIQKLKEVIASGQIGEVRAIRANFSFILYDFAGELPKRATAGALGGALMDVGCYAVDFVNSIVGDKKVQVVSATQRTSAQGLDLSTTAILKFENGVTAVIECGADMPSLNSWEVSGTKGSVAAFRFDPQGTEDVPLYVVNEESEAKLIPCPARDNFEAEFRNFAKAVLAHESPRIAARESIQTAIVIEAICGAR